MAKLLHEWYEENYHKERYEGACGDQCLYIRDTIARIVEVPLMERPYCKTEVIGSHRSKSVTLPVYHIYNEDVKVDFYLRNNFYDWKLSVISEKPIYSDFTRLFHTVDSIDPSYSGNELSSCYFEGFPEELVFKHYDLSDKKKWSASIGGNYRLYMVIFQIMSALGWIQPIVWHTRETHRVALDKEYNK